MAKAPRYEEFPPETPARVAARSILRTLLGAVTDEAPAVLRGDDDKATHDMRVAIRRLRSALDTFTEYYPRKRFRRFVRAARRLGRRLGAVRDADVHLVALRAALSAATPEERAGIAFAAESIASRRALDFARFTTEFSDFDRNEFEWLIDDV